MAKDKEASVEVKAGMVYKVSPCISANFGALVLILLLIVSPLWTITGGLK